MKTHLMSTAKRKVSDFLLREKGLNTVKPKRSTEINSLQRIVGGTDGNLPPVNPSNATFP